MELSSETEICGTHVVAAPGRRRRNQQVNVKASVETIEKFLKAADDRTIALCRSANVCALRLMLLKGLETPAASLFSATLCCVLNNLSDFRWPPKYLRSRERHENRGWESWGQKNLHERPKLVAEGLSLPTP
jgi:hypothetical protein